MQQPTRQLLPELEFSYFLLANSYSLIRINKSDRDGWLSEMPRKRRVKEGGRLAHLAMGWERIAASVPAFPTSLANAGKMPALLEAGHPACQPALPNNVYK